MTQGEIDLKELEQKTGIWDLRPIPGDVSPRLYFRGKITDPGSPTNEIANVILMVYPDRTQKNKEELLRFLAVGKWFAERGFIVPDYFSHDQEKCYGVFSDLGETSLRKAIERHPERKEEFYKQAVQMLHKMLEFSHYEFAMESYPFHGMAQYEHTKVYENRCQLIDYYAACQLQKKPSRKWVQSYIDALNEVEKRLGACFHTLIHGDYHLENIIYTHDKKCALIDYQDAFLGPAPYDLLNILEDARADVPEDIREEMINLYTKGFADEDKKVFMGWYRYLAACFHGRVLGLFIKLAAEQGRDKYLVHIPRLQNYMVKNLQDPVLKPLKDWFEKEGIDFRKPLDLDGNRIRKIFENLKEE